MRLDWSNSANYDDVVDRINITVNPATPTDAALSYSIPTTRTYDGTDQGGIAVA